MAKRKPGRTMIAASREQSPAAKATFHQLSGAGRSRVLRQFFGFSAADEKVITDRIGAALDQMLRTARG